MVREWKERRRRRWCAGGGGDGELKQRRWWRWCAGGGDGELKKSLWRDERESCFYFKACFHSQAVYESQPLHVLRFCQDDIIQVDIGGGELSFVCFSLHSQGSGSRQLVHCQCRR
eukprot:3935454-Rhodomonas_salina.1